MLALSSLRRRGGLIVGLVALFVAPALVFGSTAQAYWIGIGSGSALAPTGDLSPASNALATSTVNSDVVAVTWTEATLSTGQPATGYVIERVRNSDSVAFPACGSSAAAPIVTTSCSDPLVADGTYHYTVMAVVGSWTAASALSNDVTVDGASILPSVVVTSISPVPNVNNYNNSTPVTVNLTASPGSAGTAIASIRYSIDGGSLVVVTASTAPVAVSGDGIHSVAYSAIDTLGRVSSTSTVVVRIDTVAPVAPSAPIINVATDSGTSSTDGITRITAPVFTGTAEDGVTVTVFNGAVAIGSGVATGGVYSITSSTLTEGVKSITARASDLALNVSVPSAATAITIDTTAPATPGAPVLAAASDTGRSATDKITKLNTPTFTGTAVVGTIVTLFDGASAVGSVTAAITTYTIATSALPDGGRVITARASDIAGNFSGATASNTVTIDTLVPAAPSIPALTAASDTGRSTTDGITRNTRPTATGTNESLAIVTLYANATIVGTQTTTATAYSIRTSTLANGAYSFTATSTDVAGNVSVASGIKSVVIDTVAPAAPPAPTLIAASDTGVSSSDRITRLTVLTFTGTAEANALVQLRNTNANTGTAVIATGGAYSVTSGTLAAGARTMRVRATDVAGNVSGNSGNTIVTIDVTAPTVTINQAAAQADPTTGTTINYTVVFSETSVWLVANTVALTGTANASAGLVSGSGTTYAIAVTGMTRSGTVIADLATGTAQDTAGNLSAASTSTDKTVTFTDATAPVVVVATLTGGGSQTAVTTGTAGFGLGDAATVTVVLCSVNVYPCTGPNTLATLTPSVTAGTGAWTVTSAALGTQPTVFARATQTDLTGNAGTSTTLGPIVV